MTRKEMLANNLARLNNRYLVLKNAVALSFFVLAVVIMSPLHRQSTTARAFLTLLSAIVVILAIALIVEFIIKTIRLQNDPLVKRYSAIVSLNSLLGLVLPLFYINFLLLRIFGRYLPRFANTDTVFCEIRRSLIRFYWDNNLYNQLGNLIFWLALISLALFLWGGLIERARRFK